MVDQNDELRLHHLDQTLEQIQMLLEYVVQILDEQ
jgi:hypothetical protein